ncbi:membrane protein [Streptomyces sp. CNQ-509]|nr:membrane protein [Streptomyces sp. CNQ-509]
MTGSPGGSPARPPAHRRLLTALLLVALLLPAALVQIPTAGTAHAQPSGSRSVNVSVDYLNPSVPSGGDDLTVSGKVTNKTDAKITDPHVSLRLSGPLTSRSEVTQATERTGWLSDYDGTEIDGPGTEELKTLAPGMSRDFSITIPVNRLPLDAPGVYQLAVSLSGTSAAAGYEQVLGIEHTFLPWQPDDLSTKTRLTFVWPVIATPQLTARTEPDEQQTQTPVLASDRLLEQMEPGGRLQQMVALGEELPVTWVIDPDLLATASAMTEAYNVVDEDGETVPGKGQDTARQWLADLRNAVKGREVVALPFGDPDLAAIAHRGRKVSGTLDQLGDATTLARTTVESELHLEPETDLAWPAEGAIDKRIVGVAGAAGAQWILARSDSMTESGLSYTPTAARPIGGGRKALVADAQLSRAFEGDMSRAETYSLAIQEYLAQTLVTTLQQPNLQRSIVVAPQRTPTLGQVQAMAEALGGLDTSTWMTPLNLSSAAVEPADPGANRAVPSTGAYPKKLRKQEIPRAAFERILDTRQHLDNFSVILDNSLRVTVPFGNALLREMSTQWRGRKTEAEAFRREVQGYLEDLTSQVQLIDKSDLTLSGNSGTIPVTVQNNLLQNVRGLELRLTSDVPSRLRIEEERQSIEVAGGHSTSVKFEASARASGPVTITAQLYTADGRPFGAKKTFQVEVTSITSTVLLVIGAGILLLVLAGVRMYSQRKRAARTAETGEEADGNRDEDANGHGGGGTGGAGSPEDSADPGSDGDTGEADKEAHGTHHTGGDRADDTDTESGARSGASERVER